ncbi:hypothetical protein [Nocardioides conyzicola]|uniref:PknH-like extracellular domain-containing protein n=1 Tax=Nocardioides conyzicola TaxID=1651781 RepID=A0ABP8XNH9_9ACTN
MNRRWMSRALIALVVPALAVPALASSATAAPTVKVPTINAAAKVYPHLAGGTATETATKVYGPGKKCGQTKVVKGASGRTASYAPDYSSGDPDAYLMTGERPSVSVQAFKFPTAKAAIAYLRGYAKQAKHCPGTNPGGGGGGTGGQPHCTSKTKKIAFKLGNERWGYQIRSTCTIGDQTTSSVFNSLFARKGRSIVYTTAMSMDATAPSIPKSIAFTGIALKTAG